MLNNILNIEGAATLSKDQQRQIVGGAGPCHIYVRSNNGNGPGYWSATTYSVSDAQNHYNTSSSWAGGYQTTGYCCASCPAFLADE